MRRFLTYLFIVLGLGLIFSGSIFAVPKILKSKVLEVCIVSEDVTIFQKYQETTPGPWIKGSTVWLNKGQVLSVHRKKIKQIYQDGMLPKTFTFQKKILIFIRLQQFQD